MKNIIRFLVGVLFAIGLGISGMTQIHVVKGFLDIFGSWDLRLMGVMMGAIGVHAITYHFIIKRKAPLLDSKFYVPTRKDIDKRLLIGAALFGLGWGWAGICPGPGIVNLVSGNLNIYIFISSMLAGMFLFQRVERFIK